MKTPGIRLRNDHLVVMGSAVLLFLGALLAVQRPRGQGRDPQDALRGSSRYTSPSGGKALYALLRDLGYPATRWARKIQLLPDDLGLLLVVAPSRAPSPEEAGWLDGWVAAGGTLLWCPRSKPAGPAEDPVLAAFGLSSEGGSADVTGEVPATLKPLGGGADRTYALSVTAERRLAARPGTRAEVLAEDGKGWVAAVVPRGRGRFIALAEPRLLTNAGLSRAEHAVFAVHLAALAAGGRRIAFDEFHHGFEEGQGAFALLWDSPLMGALALGVLAAFLGILASDRRLGPPIRLRREERRKPAEFIDALAGLCRRQRAAAQVQGILLSEYRLFLRRRGGAEEQAEPARPWADEGSLVEWCRELEVMRRSVLEKGASREL